MAGQPRHAPTEKDRAIVKAMAIAGVPQDGIAGVIGISVTTLAKYYRHELDISLNEAIGFATNKLMSKIKDGNMTAIIFFLKTRAGWRETDNVNIGVQQLPDLVRKVLPKTDDDYTPAK